MKGIVSKILLRNLTVRDEGICDWPGQVCTRVFMGNAHMNKWDCMVDARRNKQELNLCVMGKMKVKIFLKK